MHPEAFSYVQQHVEGNPFENVLELGSRDVNGSPRGLLAESNYIGLDVAPGWGVDIVADARTWRTDPIFDLCLCLEVAEHCNGWEAIIATAFESLKPGGVFVFTAAGPGRAPHSAVDGGVLREGEFYRNVEPEELTEALEWAGFEVFEVDILGPDIRAYAKRSE